MAKKDLRAVHECGSNAEAEILKGYLDSFGIVATYDGADSIGFIGKYRALRGVTLRVPASQAAAARQLIAKADFSAHAVEDDDATDDWREAYARERGQTSAQAAQQQICPNCGAREVHEERPPRWMNLLLFGLPMLFYKATWACEACGWYWHP